MMVVAAVASVLVAVGSLAEEAGGGQVSSPPCSEVVEFHGAA